MYGVDSVVISAERSALPLVSALRARHRCCPAPTETSPLINVIPTNNDLGSSSSILFSHSLTHSLTRPASARALSHGDEQPRIAVAPPIRRLPARSVARPRRAPTLHRPPAVVVVAPPGSRNGWLRAPDGDAVQEPCCLRLRHAGKVPQRHLRVRQHRHHHQEAPVLRVGAVHPRARHHADGRQAGPDSARARRPAARHAARQDPVLHARAAAGRRPAAALARRPRRHRVAHLHHPDRPRPARRRPRALRARRRRQQLQPRRGPRRPRPPARRARRRRHHQRELDVRVPRRRRPPGLQGPVRRRQGRRRRHQEGARVAPPDLQDVGATASHPAARVARLFFFWMLCSVWIKKEIELLHSPPITHSLSSVTACVQKSVSFKLRHGLWLNVNYLL